MANKTITGDDWSVAGDWDPSRPVTGDTAIVPPTNGNNIIMGAGDDGGVDLGAFNVHHLFKNLIGSSPTPIAVGGADLITVYGSTGFYFEADHDDVADKTIDQCVIQMPNNGTPVELGSRASVASVDALWAELMLNRGHVTLKSNILYTAGAIVRVNSFSRPDDVTLIIASGGPTLPNLRINGGLAKNNSVATDITLSSGKLVQDLAAATNLYIHKGGWCDYDHTSATLIEVMAGGTLDLLKNAKVKTITTLWTHPGSTLIYDPNLHTFTTDNNRGGTRIIGTPS